MLNTFLPSPRLVNIAHMLQQSLDEECTLSPIYRPSKNGIFLGEMQRHMSHEEEQKFFFAAARLFWPEGCLRDFFGLKKAEGLLKAKKNPENSP